VPFATTTPEKAPTRSRVAPALGAVPFLLALPAFIPLLIACVRAWSHGLVPTGFVQYDLPYYVANARQHFAGGFHLTYGNPYAPYGSPAIYFQPHIFLLSILDQIGLDPGISLNLFGIFAVAFGVAVAARLYRQIVGWNTTAEKLGLIVFFWGGGVLAIAGLLFGLPAKMTFARSSLLFDPNEGWWMLNFGRNLVYPTEAFYHGIFLLAMLMLLREKIAWALALSALLAITHPYAGLSLALILAAFGFVEMLAGSGRKYAGLFAGAVAIAAAHVGYYMVFLNRFADHRALRAQWELDWPYLAWTFGPALYLVGFLTFARFTRWTRTRELLKDRKTRLFLIWFAVVFALTQHDLFIKPMQPIHFTHGYDWIALFFLASPAIIALIEKALAQPRPIMRTAAVALILTIFLFDNLTWLWSFRDPSVQRYTITLTHGERDTLDWLRAHAATHAIVVSEDRWINYLTATYTNSRAWFGHDYNTPQAELRRKETEAAFREAKYIHAGSTIYYVPRRETSWNPPESAKQVYANSEFVIWQVLDR
jgi:hypothetical protein